MDNSRNMESKPLFFPTPADWRVWLEKHHADAVQLWVGFYKRNSGMPSITWPQSVDGALCFGWIDGIRKSIDATSYKIRFTPRKRRSRWSTINIRRVKALSKLGLMHAAGLAAFRARQADRSGLYSYEQRKQAKLPAAYEKSFRLHSEARKFFRAQAPWYQRSCCYWIISARKEETRARRLATLIDCSARKRRIPPLSRPSGK